MVGRRRVALIALLLLSSVALGCVDVTSATPTPVQVHPHATGERDLLLRMSIVGGLPWPAKTLEDPPVFSLFGSGLVIHETTSRAADGSLSSELRRAQLSDAQVDALLADALGPGGLASAQERYVDVDVYDAVTTRFEVHAGEADKIVNVYALGLVDETAPSRVERAMFHSLASRLGAFNADVEAGKATDLGGYEPAAYRVTLAAPTSPDSTTFDWPWADLAPFDFAPDGDGNLVLDVAADQGKAVLELNVLHDLNVQAPNGVVYMIRIQPLMPDELS